MQELLPNINLAYLNKAAFNLQMVIHVDISPVWCPTSWVPGEISFYCVK